MTSIPANHTPFTCYKLDGYIAEVVEAPGITIDEKSRISRDLTASALRGDCQFNRRCRQHDTCPMAPQTLQPRTNFTREKTHRPRPSTTNPDDD